MSPINNAVVESLRVRRCSLKRKHTTFSTAVKALLALARKPVEDFSCHIYRCPFSDKPHWHLGRLRGERPGEFCNNTPAIARQW